MVAVCQITDGSHAILAAAARAARPIHPHAPGYGRIGRVQLSRRARSNGGDGDRPDGSEGFYLDPPSRPGTLRSLLNSRDGVSGRCCIGKHLT